VGARRHQRTAAACGTRSRQWHAALGLDCGDFQRREGHEVAGSGWSVGLPPTRKKAGRIWGSHRVGGKEAVRDLGNFRYTPRLYRVAWL
jgi:hypothetical protein